MKRTSCRLVFCLMVFVPSAANAQATSASRLPTAIAALVPSGAQVSSPTFGKTFAFAAADFVAEKRTSANHTADYKFHLLCYDTKSPLWKMQAPIYRADMEKKIDSKRASFASVSAPPVSYDTVKEAKYSWGTGFTQRVVHHTMGAGTGKDTIDYRAAYIGMINGAMFELSVGGVPTADEADQWAKNVAAKASVINLSNIGN